MYAKVKCSSCAGSALVDVTKSRSGTYVVLCVCLGLICCKDRAILRQAARYKS